MRKLLAFFLFFVLSFGAVAETDYLAEKEDKEIWKCISGLADLIDWDTVGQNIVGTTPSRHTYTIAFPDPAITGEVYVVGRIKYTAASIVTKLNVYMGSGAASHLSVSE